MKYNDKIENKFEIENMYDLDTILTITKNLYDRFSTYSPNEIRYAISSLNQKDQKVLYKNNENPNKLKKLFKKIEDIINNNDIPQEKNKLVIKNGKDKTEIESKELYPDFVSDEKIKISKEEKETINNSLVKDYEELNDKYMEELLDLISKKTKYYYKKYDPSCGLTREIYVIYSLRADFEAMLCTKFVEMERDLNDNNIEDYENIESTFMNKYGYVKTLYNKFNDKIDDNKFRDIVNKTMYEYDKKEFFSLKLVNNLKKRS